MTDKYHQYDTKLVVSFTDMRGRTVTVALTGVKQEDVPRVLSSRQLFTGLGVIDETPGIH